MINPSGYALGFIIYHTKHVRVYVSYIPHEVVAACGPGSGLTIQFYKLTGRVKGIYNIVWSENVKFLKKHSGGFYPTKHARTTTVIEPVDGKV